MLGMLIFKMWWLSLAEPHVELVTYTNTPFISFLFNWHEHYKRLGLHYNVTVYALDDGAYTRLTDAGVPAARWTTSHNESVAWGSNGYNQLVQTKPFILQQHASRMSVGDILTWFDVDSVWFSDPLPHLGSCRIATQMEITPKFKTFCTGFMMFNIYDGIQSFFKRWIDTLGDNSHDQVAFNSIAKFYKPCELPTDKFPSGYVYPNFSPDIVIFHNNFVVGYANKLERFKKKGFWALD